MNVQIRLAETRAELEALYAFRYRIYVEEMERPQKHADHTTRQIRDPLDTVGYNLVGWSRGEIVGCVRVNFARDGYLEYYRSLLRMDADPASWPNAVSLCTRLMIAPDWRRSALAMRLSVAAFELGLQNNIHWNFIDCNDHLLSFFERMGYVATHRAVHDEYGRVNAMRFDLHDREQLTRRGSPFRRSLEQWSAQQVRRPARPSNQRGLRSATA